MTCAQALAIAAAALVFAEPNLPLRAYVHVGSAMSRLQGHALARLEHGNLRVASLPDRHCISRGKLLL